MKEILKTYEANKYEDEIYKLWEESGFFSPDKIKSKKKYCNILPPPNANGELHLGHASGYTVMDIFGRYHRMKGEKVLLFPGKDHAGIQSQVVYEKKLEKELWQEVVRMVFLTTIDKFWMDHLTAIEDLREGINLRGS